MLYFDRIDVSEGNDVNKTSNSKKCHVCQYLYFLNKGFKFQPNVSNRCHDLLMMSMNISDMAKVLIIALLLVKLANGAINLMQNTNLPKKAEHHKT